MYRRMGDVLFLLCEMFMDRLDRTMLIMDGIINSFHTLIKSDFVLHLLVPGLQVVKYNIFWNSTEIKLDMNSTHSNLSAAVFNDK